MQLKEICKEVRKQKKLTQRELALLVGTSQTEISFIEGGFIPPDATKIAKLQKMFEELKG